MRRRTLPRRVDDRPRFRETPGWRGQNLTGLRIEAPEGICRVLVRMEGLNSQVQAGDKVRFNEGVARVFAVDEHSLTLEW